MESGKGSASTHSRSNDTTRPQRPQWTKSFDFLFAVVGMSVGLGNIWRFPYLCFKNGGGAFLIPYFIFVVLLAVPVVVLEISVGQRVRKGIAKSWEIVPIFKGIAFAQTMVVFHSNVSYPIILVWALKYLVSSFSATLPWSTCDNSWNSPNCVTPTQDVTLSVANHSAAQDLLHLAAGANFTRKTISSATEYWIHAVLRVSSGVDDPGSLCPDLVLYLVILWVAIYFCTFRGVGWTAKIVYVTATLPFVLIGVILIRGVTLDGAREGLKYYIVPDMKRLAAPSVWTSAGTQVLYSYGTGCGALATMGSYNDYNHNFLRDSILVSIMNSIASVLSGVAVFSTLGFMAHYQNTTVESVASSGPGLAFIAYPEALSLLPVPQLWCALFFLTLLFLGFDSQFVCQETFTSFFFDIFPSLRRRRELVQAFFCITLMTLGLSMVTEGGVYVFEMYNNYAFAGWFLFFTAGCEFVALAWCYGFQRYWDDITDMIGNRPGKMWLLVSWKFIGPMICFTITIYYLVIQKPLKYRNYTYPVWAQVFSHFMTLSSVCWIPAVAIYQIAQVYKGNKTLTEILRKEKAPKMQANDVLLPAEPK